MSYSQVYSSGHYCPFTPKAILELMACLIMQTRRCGSEPSVGVRYMLESSILEISNLKHHHDAGQLLAMPSLKEPLEK